MLKIFDNRDLAVLNEGNSGTPDINWSVLIAGACGW